MLLPVNSVHVDVLLQLSPPALVQLALHAATDTPEEPNHGCQEAQYDHDVGRQRLPGEGNLSTLGPQVDPATGQHTSPREQDGVSPGAQMLLHIHDLPLLQLRRGTDLSSAQSFRSPDEWWSQQSTICCFQGSRLSQTVVSYTLWTRIHVWALDCVCAYVWK